MNVNKKAFKVKLNYHGELHEFTTFTTRPDIAVRNAIYKLSQKLGRDLFFVQRDFYDGDKILVTQLSK